MVKKQINIYVDESKDRKDVIKDKWGNYNNWDYYSLVVIPKEKEERLLKELMDARCISRGMWKDDCAHPCGFHERNFTEIHYKDISQNHEYLVANNWVNLLLNDGLANKGKIYFYILGINKTYLDYGFWRHLGDPEGEIYKRFFQTAIKGMKYFFPTYDLIEILNIFHDDSRMEQDENFYYGLLSMLLLDQRFSYLADQIHFMNSDHRKSGRDESHFLQLSDLILGLVTNYIHLSSDKEKKLQLTHQMHDLVSRLLKHPKNVNSKYNYHRKQQIQFFPSRADFYKKMMNLNGHEVSVPFEDLFFTSKKCAYEERITSKNQRSLGDFLPYRPKL